MSDVEAAAQRVAIGIAFGNSYSSIAYTSPEGKAEVIANEDGDRQIPSILSYVDGEEFHGGQAKAQLIRNASNTVVGFRDFLGQDFKSIDPTPCHQSAHPREHESSIVFNIKDTADGDAHNVTVKEIATRHLRRLQTSASDYLGKAVNAAVLTVPTNYTDAHKKALKEAAAGAGMEVLQFIHEPVAAILAYDARPGAKLGDKNTVVVDLGATRSDVAVVANRGGIYSILASVHDYDVAGAQLDGVLVDYFAKEFLKKHAKTTKEDPKDNARSLAKLKQESEAVKKALSLGSSATFSVESLAAGLDFSCSVNRSRFDMLASKHYAAISRVVAHAVEKASLDLLDVDEIILSGGTAHVPRIATNLSREFTVNSPNKTPVVVQAPSTNNHAINPSELAARGAAIQASLVETFEQDDIEQSTHPMVTATAHLSRAVGLVTQQTSGGPGEHAIEVLVQSDTPVPVRRTATIKAVKGGDVLVRICEIDREIKVTKPEPKAKKEPSGEDDDDEDSDEEEEEEDVREKALKAGRTLAEAAIKDVKAGGQVEVQLNIGADMALQVIAREVGSKGGVRGNVQAPALENGKA